jgi:hypothetical protein
MSPIGAKKDSPKILRGCNDFGSWYRYFVPSKSDGIRFHFSRAGSFVPRAPGVRQCPKCWRRPFPQKAIHGPSTLYRIASRPCSNIASGVIEANGLYAYPHTKIAALNRIIEDNVTLIDDILMVFISPEAREFSIDQLAHDYDYPVVDLSEIDADWI